MSITERPEESTNLFLNRLADALTSHEALDSDLAGILAAHILSSDPAADAVSQAKTAILKLAEGRAANARKATDD